MARLRCTHEAEQWLRDIFDYIAQDKPDAAERVVNGIYEKSQLLRDISCLTIVFIFLGLIWLILARST